MGTKGKGGQDPKEAAPDEHQGEAEIPEDQEGSFRPVALEAGLSLSNLPSSVLGSSGWQSRLIASRVGMTTPRGPTVMI